MASVSSVVAMGLRINGSEMLMKSPKATVHALQPFQGWSFLNLPRVGAAAPTLGCMIPTPLGLAGNRKTLPMRCGLREITASCGLRPQARAARRLRVLFVAARRRGRRAKHPLSEAVKAEINHRRRIEREQLAHDQAADDGDAERTAQFRAGARAEGQGKAAEPSRPAWS